MCGPLFAWFVGRHNNKAFVDGPRGSNVNTRVVKLNPLSKQKEGTKPRVEGEEGDEDVEVNGRIEGMGEGIEGSQLKAPVWYSHSMNKKAVDNGGTMN
jgi:hypothetical protein